MKRILVRLAILLLLGSATLWMTNRSKGFDCVNPSTMFDQMAACDDTYWNGAADYRDVFQNNPNHCHQIAHNSAWSQCGAYGSCYDAAYAAAYNNCVNAAASSYQQAGSAYSSCLWNANNPSCFETMEFCPAARDRANQCEALATGDECCDYSECLNASGVWQCQ